MVTDIILLKREKEIEMEDLIMEIKKLKCTIIDSCMPGGPQINDVTIYVNILDIMTELINRVRKDK